MQTQLMGASGEREEFNQSSSFFAPDYPVAGLSRFAELPVNHLPGAVIRIGAKG